MDFETIFTAENPSLNREKFGKRKIAKFEILRTAQEEGGWVREAEVVGEGVRNEKWATKMTPEEVTYIVKIFEEECTGGHEESRNEE